MPTDLGDALAHDSTAWDFFETLSYTHRKEWVRWVHEAKEPETRSARDRQDGRRSPRRQAHPLNGPPQGRPAPWRALSAEDGLAGRCSAGSCVASLAIFSGCVLVCSLWFQVGVNAGRQAL